MPTRNTLSISVSAKNIKNHSPCFPPAWYRDFPQTTTATTRRSTRKQIRLRHIFNFLPPSSWTRNTNQHKSTREKHGRNKKHSRIAFKIRISFRYRSAFSVNVYCLYAKARGRKFGETGVTPSTS